MGHFELTSGTAAATDADSPTFVDALRIAATAAAEAARVQHAVTTQAVHALVERGESIRSIAGTLGMSKSEVHRIAMRPADEWAATPGSALQRRVDAVWAEAAAAPLSPSEVGGGP